MKFYGNFLTACSVYMLRDLPLDILGPILDEKTIYFVAGLSRFLAKYRTFDFERLHYVGVHPGHCFMIYAP